MRRWTSRRGPLAPVPLLLVAAAGGIVACTSPDAPVAPTEGSGASPGSARAAQGGGAPVYLVTFRDDVTDVRGLANALARRGGFTLASVREHAARGFTAVVPPAFVDQLRADPRVLIVEQDGPVSLDLPREAARPGGGGGSGQSVSYGLTRVGGSVDGTGKTAWIIDTGIDLAHPDLNTTRACHASFVRTTTPDDGNGHGTHVAGVIAAKNNTIGTLGIAANAYVCAVRVLDNAGSGQWSWIIEGVNYVARNGRSGEVANMSLGGSGTNATLEKAVLDASGVVKFAIAAGNSGANAANYTPARVNGPNVYTVSAVDSRDCMASWSNWGNPPVDYAAPGVGILSLYKGGGTKSLSGTSMASPHVAGLLLSGGVRANGSACNDPDGNPDPIAHR
jgi:subtilisin family serine protease